MINDDYKSFFLEVKSKIREAQYEAMKIVNTHLINLYWDLGKMIVEKQEKFGWGKSIVENLSIDLQKEFPGVQGFSKSNLWAMSQFYLEYNKNEFLQPLVGEISWSKHIAIMTKCKDVQERRFYILSTKKFGWTKDVLINQIENKSFEKYLLNQTNFNSTVSEKIRDQVNLLLKICIPLIFLNLARNIVSMNWKLN